ncbi:DUF2586 domain-containing protein [Desulfoluna sp.]|uniref:DUF2586 domain-containing protein n=1 Tax=Desulfoluna sp. TaxID=2045199 RepID=UPI00260A19AE|nr:DUF2586 domain-containing protein [Desulfoluna sp.]
MSLGIVQINRLNLMQGPLPEIERHFLFIGLGTVNVGKVLSVGTSTDFDEALGDTDSNLKTQVKAAMVNAGQNWGASVMPIAAETTWANAVDYAMEVVSCEAIVITDAVAQKTDLEAMYTKARSILATYMRPVFFMASVRGCGAEEAWADYIAAVKPIVDGVAADQVCVVPALWGPDQGTLAGRLCNRAVTVADTPMRVATGPLVGTFGEKPTDKDGVMITMAHLKALDTVRFSVPQWYPDFPGVYWGDCNMLDVPGGDYQVSENLRVIQKAMRRVYPLTVARIGDRRLNSTPESIAQNSSYFMRPLMKMSIGSRIGKTVFPGEIHPPARDAITIVWVDKNTVRIYMKARPYNCPKDITVNLMLDLSS